MKENGGSKSKLGIQNNNIPPTGMHSLARLKKMLSFVMRAPERKEE